MISAATAITQSAWVPTTLPDPRRRKESGYGFTPFCFYTSSPASWCCLTKHEGYAHAFFCFFPSLLPFFTPSHLLKNVLLAFMGSLTGSFFENISLFLPFHTISTVQTSVLGFFHILLLLMCSFSSGLHQVCALQELWNH